MVEARGQSAGEGQQRIGEGVALDLASMRDEIRPEALDQSGSARRPIPVHRQSVARARNLNGRVRPLVPGLRKP